MQYNLFCWITEFYALLFIVLLLFPPYLDVLEGSKNAQIDTLI